MRLTVLGSSASCAGAGQACAGHFLEAGGARILFDCGNGVLSNLGSLEDPTALDAVFITHNHPDHYADIYCLQAMLRYAPTGPAAPIPLYLPEGLFDRLQVLLSDRGGHEMAEAFVPISLMDGETVRVGDVIITPYEVPHTPPTFALRAEVDGTSLCYSSDTLYGDEILRAATGVDLLLAEATLPEEYAGKAPHMTASEAGRLGREAGVRALALTHVWYTNDRETMATLATEEFGHQVFVAQEFDSFDLTPVNGRDD
ncbi:MAG: MBL fold metallo-hydrolase [Coriobacteriia bacterium]|nr:MBL fold metallo-hydrolase [Coriobacteriia bacterium]